MVFVFGGVLVLLHDDDGMNDWSLDGALFRRRSILAGRCVVCVDSSIITDLLLFSVSLDDEDDAVNCIEQQSSFRPKLIYMCSSRSTLSIAMLSIISSRVSLSEGVEDDRTECCSISN